jgi:hypothetical protein
VSRSLALSSILRRLALAMNRGEVPLQNELVAEFRRWQLRRSRPSALLPTRVVRHYGGLYASVERGAPRAQGPQP